MISPAEKWFKVLARLGIPFLILGIMFKIMHWPGGTIMIVCALSCIGIFYACMFVAKRSKNTLDVIRLVLTVSLAVYGMLHILHWPGKLIPAIVVLFSFFAWIWFDGPSWTHNNSGNDVTVSKKISNVLLAVGAITTVIGILFKIMHWPWGSVILVAGIACLAVSFFSGALKDE